MGGLSRQLTGDDKRGNSYDRRARRAWLLSAASGFGGDGEKVGCWECGAKVSMATLYVDRIEPGGSYRRANIRPHCPGCSHRQGARMRWEAARAADPYTDDGNCRGCGVEFWTGLREGHAEGCPTPELDGR